LFFLKKEPKTLALRGLNLLNGSFLEADSGGPGAQESS
jgi:hypothetical protein